MNEDVSSQDEGTARADVHTQHTKSLDQGVKQMGSKWFRNIPNPPGHPSSFTLCVRPDDAEGDHRVPRKIHLSGTHPHTSVRVLCNDPSDQRERASSHP